MSVELNGLVRLGIAGESPRDAARVTQLVDRLCLESVEWAADQAPGFLDTLRLWTGLGDEAFLDTHQVRKRAAGKRFGKFDGRTADSARMFQKVLWLFADDAGAPAAVVIAGDLDGENDRLRGFEQAVSSRRWPFQVVRALAQPEFEAWLISAWQPESDAETARLASIRAEFGFDPRQGAHRLTSTDVDNVRDAKRVLARLVLTGRTMDERWNDVPMAVLDGSNATHLAEFLADCRAVIVPLIAGAQSRG